MARPILELSSVARRWAVPAYAKRTLTEVLEQAPRARVPPKGKAAEEPVQEDTTTRDVGTYVQRNDVGFVGAADDWKLETFIISKRPGEAYFRSNPEWIAQYVVMKFRKLLIQLKDESLCIDYDMMKKKKETFAWRGARNVDPNEQRMLAQAAFKRGDADASNVGAEGAIGGTGQTVQGVGEGLMLPKKVSNGKIVSRQQYMARLARTTYSTNRADRRAIIRTLSSFPFPTLKAHGKGHIRFLDALRYFQRELRCEVVRQWTEPLPDVGAAEGKDERLEMDKWKACEDRPTLTARSKGGAADDALSPMDEDENAVFYAELRVPEFSSEGTGLLNKWMDRRWQVEQRQKTDATRVLCHWMGDNLQPFDASFGNIRNGMQWQGGGAGLGDAMDPVADWAGFGRLERSNRASWLARRQTEKKWAGFVNVKHKLVGPAGFATVAGKGMGLPSQVVGGIMTSGTYRDLRR